MNIMNDKEKAKGCVKVSQYKQFILNYGDDVCDLESSPFESLRMLYDRTDLYKVQDELDFDEKVLLGIFDLKLIENAEKMVEHISQIYNFDYSSNIPYEQWWWHLDKIANGIMSFSVSSEVKKIM